MFVWSHSTVYVFRMIVFMMLFIFLFVFWFGMISNYIETKLCKMWPLITNIQTVDVFCWKIHGKELSFFIMFLPLVWDSTIVKFCCISICHNFIADYYSHILEWNYLLKGLWVKNSLSQQNYRPLVYLTKQKTMKLIWWESFY